MRVIISALATVCFTLCPAWVAAECNQCPGDFNGDQHVTVDEILVSVSNALNGCPPPTPRFVDNGNGTITDTKTGLQWEKKSDDESVHDQDNAYSWSDTGTAADGTVFTEFLTTLNQTSFAGHDDWRLPTASELESLLEFGHPAPLVGPAFNTACAAGCTVLTCSCTALEYHWSSTTVGTLTDNALNVDFNYGLVNLYEKTIPGFYVRAVRAL